MGIIKDFSNRISSQTKASRLFEESNFIQADSLGGERSAETPLFQRNDGWEPEGTQMFEQSRSGHEPSGLQKDKQLRDDVGSEPTGDGPARHLRDPLKKKIHIEPQSDEVSMDDKEKTLAKRIKAVDGEEDLSQFFADLYADHGHAGPYPREYFDAAQINPERLVSQGLIEAGYYLTEEGRRLAGVGPEAAAGVAAPGAAPEAVGAPGAPEGAEIPPTAVISPEEAAAPTAMPPTEKVPWESRMGAPLLEQWGYPGASLTEKEQRLVSDYDERVGIAWPDFLRTPPSSEGVEFILSKVPDIMTGYQRAGEIAQTNPYDLFQQVYGGGAGLSQAAMLKTSQDPPLPSEAPAGEVAAQPMVAGEEPLAPEEEAIGDDPVSLMHGPAEYVEGLQTTLLQQTPSLHDVFSRLGRTLPPSEGEERQVSEELDFYDNLFDQAFATGDVDAIAGAISNWEAGKRDLPSEQRMMLDTRLEQLKVSLPEDTRESVSEAIGRIERSRAPILSRKSWWKKQAQQPPEELLGPQPVRPERAEAPVAEEQGLSRRFFELASQKSPPWSASEYPEVDMEDFINAGWIIPQEKISKQSFWELTQSGRDALQEAQEQYSVYQPGLRELFEGGPGEQYTAMEPSIGGVEPEIATLEEWEADVRDLYADATGMLSDIEQWRGFGPNEVDNYIRGLSQTDSWEMLGEEHQQGILNEAEVLKQRLVSETETQAIPVQSQRKSSMGSLTIKEVARYSPLHAKAMKQMGLQQVDKNAFLNRLKHTMVESIGKARNQLSVSALCSNMSKSFVDGANPESVAENSKKAIASSKLSKGSKSIANLFLDFCMERANKGKLPQEFASRRFAFNLYVEKQAAFNNMTPAQFIGVAGKKVEAKDYHRYDFYNLIPDGAGEGSENYDDREDIVYTAYRAKGERKDQSGASIGSGKEASLAMRVCKENGEGNYVIEGRSRSDDAYWGKWVVHVNASGLVDKYQKVLDLVKERGA